MAIGKTRHTHEVDADRPRGVLHQRLERGAFTHARRAPSAMLAQLIDHYWQVTWDLRGLPAQQQETLPHPNVQFVVEPGWTGIYGVHTRRFVHMLKGRSQAFGIKFKAGGFFPFFGAPVSRLQNRSLAASDIFGDDAVAFETSILAGTDVDAMAAAAERLLLAQLPPLDPNVARATGFVAMIAADRSMTTVEQLAAHTGMDKRALQRLFNQYVGIGPKWVINRYRLHEAIAQLQAGTPVAWAELALKLGYFDQAHFIRDFRALVGRSPAAYARAQG